MLQLPIRSTLGARRFFFSRWGRQNWVAKPRRRVGKAARKKSLSPTSTTRSDAPRRWRARRPLASRVNSKLFSFRYVTWQVIWPLPPGAQCSVDAWRREDSTNPRNPGNTKAEYNVLLTAHLFTTKKKGGEIKYLPQNVFRCRVGREEMKNAF